MSVKASTWAWEQEISPNYKLVLMALADHAWDDGTNAFPSTELIAEKTGYSVRQVRRLLGEMVEAEIIWVRNPSTPTKPTEYALPIGSVVVSTRRKRTRTEETGRDEDKLSPPSEDVLGGTNATGGEDKCDSEPVPNVPLTVSNHQENPKAQTPGSADALFEVETPREIPTARHLVAAWVDGYRETHGGSDPHAATMRRVAGQCGSLAKACQSLQEWTDAWHAAKESGRRNVVDPTKMLGGGQAPAFQKFDATASHVSLAEKFAAEDAHRESMRGRTLPTGPVMGALG